MSDFTPDQIRRLDHAERSARVATSAAQTATKAMLLLAAIPVVQAAGIALSLLIVAVWVYAA